MSGGSAPYAAKTSGAQQLSLGAAPASPGTDAVDRGSDRIRGNVQSTAPLVPILRSA
jgi:hypothetical protein